jgi:transposase
LPFCVAPVGSWPKLCRRWMTGTKNKRNTRSKARAGNWTEWRRESERNNPANMMSQAQRTAILELSAKGVSKREIARVLHLSRLSVRKVLLSNSTQVPPMHGAEKAEPYRQQILDLWISCKGNLVRVHEELTADGARLSYPALTAFCRRQGIGQASVVPAGQYHFEPGVEMQHDTSPHAVEVGGKKYQAQTASAVLCYSRLLFFQINPTFQRFDCKVFLTDALRYVGGVVERVMIDNTHVVVLRGTGREMIPVPEMEAFADRFGFRFVAHERGDANRSARVERPFAFIEGNFLAGRTFAGWDDVNQQARQWCDRVNSTYIETYQRNNRPPFQIKYWERPRLETMTREERPSRNARTAEGSPALGTGNRESRTRTLGQSLVLPSLGSYTQCPMGQDP